MRRVCSPIFLLFSCCLCASSVDNHMPEMDGPTATCTLRRAHIRVPVVGVTGDMMPEERAHFLACGADGTISTGFIAHPLSAVACLSDVLGCVGCAH